MIVFLNFVSNPSSSNLKTCNNAHYKYILVKLYIISMEEPQSFTVKYYI